MHPKGDGRDKREKVIWWQYRVAAAHKTELLYNWMIYLQDRNQNIETQNGVSNKEF